MNPPIIVSALILFLSLPLFAQTKQTDREFEGLRGTVKSVLTERADATMMVGKLIETNRRKHTFIAYERTGSRLTIQSYAYKSGELFHTMTFQIVNGERVSLNEFIVRPESNLNQSDPRNRYKRKYTYQYDKNGSVTEESVWNERGGLFVRNVYGNRVGERQELGYRGDGTLNQKYSYNLDAKGNVVELSVYNPVTNAVTAKEKYEYLKFDKKGNWTKRVEWESFIGGKFVYKVREVRYRALKYF